MKFNKKTIKKIGLGSLVVGAMLLIGNVAMAADTGVWTSMRVAGNITPNLTLTVGEELRFGDLTDLSLARQHTDIGLSTKVGNAVTLGVLYRNISTGEQRVAASIGARLLTGTLNVDGVAEVQLRDGDTLRGRTAVTASTDVSGLSPFVSDELFVDDSGISGNRLSIGVTRALNKTLGVNAFYMLDTAGTDFANSTHVLGLGLGVSL